MQKDELIALLAAEEPNMEKVSSLKNKYPYASIFHHIGLGEFSSEQEVSQAAIYKKDPILFARCVNGKTVKAKVEQVSSATEIEQPSIDSEDKLVTINESAGYKTAMGHKKDLTEHNASIVDDMLNTQLDFRIQKIEETTAEETTSIIETEQSLQEQKTDGQEPIVVQPKAGEDILEIIKELPEENPIKRKSIFEAHIADDASGSIEEVSEASEDPKDLMVMMSFSDWLSFFKQKKENELEEEKGKKALRSAWQKEKLAEAMDDDDDEVPEQIFKQAMESISFSPGLVSEPLAELFAQQGKIDKAIEMYKKLSLQNPEKRPYFATKIKELHLSK